MKKILILPHPMLRQKASRIKEVTKKEIEISENMQELLKKAPGVGLAANQIGILKEIVAINFEDKEQKLNKNYVLFNPEIISFSKETVIMEEGCLSLPQQYADIERPSSIKIKYKDETNKIIEENKSGFEARILQHEIDHLSGKLFIDFLSSLRRNKIIKRIKKLKKMGAI